MTGTRLWIKLFVASGYAAERNERWRWIVVDDPGRWADPATWVLEAPRGAEYRSRNLAEKFARAALDTRGAYAGTLP